VLTQLHNKLPDQFRVIAKNPQDTTYFVENMTLSTYFWCYAQQTLSPGQTLQAIIKPPLHPEDYPVLIIYDWQKVRHLRRHKMSRRTRASRVGHLHYQPICALINKYGGTFYFLALPKASRTPLSKISPNSPLHSARLKLTASLTRRDEHPTTCFAIASEQIYSILRIRMFHVRW